MFNMNWDRIQLSGLIVTLRTVYSVIHKVAAVYCGISLRLVYCLQWVRCFLNFLPPSTQNIWNIYVSTKETVMLRCSCRATDYYNNCVRTVSKMSVIQCFRPGHILEPKGRQQSQLMFCLPSVGCVPREIREHRPKASPSYSSHYSIGGLSAFRCSSPQ